MSKRVFSPVVAASWSLYALIALLVTGIGFGSHSLHTTLVTKAVAVDHKKIDSELNETALLNAQRLSRILDENHDSVERASAIVADTKHYEYQNQIVSDITSYAAEAKLTVLGFSFIDPTTTTGKPSAAKMKSVVASISLASPVPYENYLTFLKLIERNLTKMQVTQLDISNSTDSPGAISSPTITLEVYVR